MATNVSIAALDDPNPNPNSTTDAPHKTLHVLQWTAQVVLGVRALWLMTSAQPSGDEDATSDTRAPRRFVASSAGARALLAHGSGGRHGDQRGASH